MKAEMHFAPQLPRQVIFKLIFLGGILLGSVFGLLQLFMKAINLFQ